MYVYIYICVCVCVYIYIYIYTLGFRGSVKLGGSKRTRETSGLMLLHEMQT